MRSAAGRAFPRVDSAALDRVRGSSGPTGGPVVRPVIW